MLWGEEAERLLRLLDLAGVVWLGLVGSLALNWDFPDNDLARGEFGTEAGPDTDSLAGGAGELVLLPPLVWLVSKAFILKRRRRQVCLDIFSVLVLLPVLY